MDALRVYTFGVVVSLAAVALLTGCATIDPRPFKEFSEGLQELRTGEIKL